MEIIFATSDFGEALVKKALLEQEGFFVYMDNYNWGSAEPYMGFTLGYRLWGVPQELEDARYRLYEAESEEGFAPGEYDPISVCPDCGSEAIIRYRSIWWLTMNVVIGVFLAAPGGNLRKCMDCGHRFKSKGPAITEPFKMLIGFWLLYVILVSSAGYIWMPDFLNFAATMR